MIPLSRNALMRRAARSRARHVSHIFHGLLGERRLWQTLIEHTWFVRRVPRAAGGMPCDDGCQISDAMRGRRVWRVDARTRTRDSLDFPYQSFPQRRRALPPRRASSPRHHRVLLSFHAFLQYGSQQQLPNPREPEPCSPCPVRASADYDACSGSDVVRSAESRSSEEGSRGSARQCTSAARCCLLGVAGHRWRAHLHDLPNLVAAGRSEATTAVRNLA